VNHKQGARVMRSTGIAGYRRKRRAKTTQPDAAAQKVPNLLARDFTAAATNMKYVSDTTHLPPATGANLYLATPTAGVRGWLARMGQVSARSDARIQAQGVSNSSTCGYKRSAIASGTKCYWLFGYNLLSVVCTDAFARGLSAG
jgi:hypothetical protein